MFLGKVSDNEAMGWIEILYAQKRGEDRSLAILHDY
jgi:hypothetical protein